MMPNLNTICFKVSAFRTTDTIDGFTAQEFLKKLEIFNKEIQGFNNEECNRESLFLEVIQFLIDSCKKSKRTLPQTPRYQSKRSLQYHRIHKFSYERILPSIQFLNPSTEQSWLLTDKFSQNFVKFFNEGSWLDASQFRNELHSLYLASLLSPLNGSVVDLLKKFGFDDPYFFKVKPLDLNDCYLLFNEASNESMFEATTNDQTFLTDSFPEIMDSIIIPPFSDSESSDSEDGSEISSNASVASDLAAVDLSDNSGNPEFQPGEDVSSSSDDTVAFKLLPIISTLKNSTGFKKIIKKLNELELVVDNKELFENLNSQIVSLQEQVERFDLDANDPEEIQKKSMEIQKEYLSISDQISDVKHSYSYKNIDCFKLMKELSTLTNGSFNKCDWFTAKNCANFLKSQEISFKKEQERRRRIFKDSYIFKPNDILHQVTTFVYNLGVVHIDRDTFNTKRVIRGSLRVLMIFIRNYQRDLLF